MSGQDKSEISRVAIGLIVVGGVAGMVFGARYMRDMQGLSKDLAKASSGFVSPRRVVKSSPAPPPQPPQPPPQPHQVSPPTTDPTVKSKPQVGHVVSDEVGETGDQAPKKELK